MLIAQYHPVLSERDAIGNEIAALQALYRRAGHDCLAFAAHRENGWRSEADTLDALSKARPDLLLLHYSLGDLSFERLSEHPAPKVLIYHGVTPPALMSAEPPALLRQAAIAPAQLARLRHSLAGSMCHSRFMARDLETCGYSGVRVLPYCVREDLLAVPPDPASFRRLAHARERQLLLLGRVVSHKQIETALLVLSHLQRRGRARWSLNVVGPHDPASAYVSSLRSFGRFLGVRGVRFTGSLPQAEVNAYLRTAAALLVTSKHEGFCVPVIEAFHHGCPVFAYPQEGVAETLGGVGVQMPSAEPLLMACALETVLLDEPMRRAVLETQAERLTQFSAGLVEEQWLRALEEWIPAPAAPRLRAAQPSLRT
jgi:L-malate glycosyltransferase